MKKTTKKITVKTGYIANKVLFYFLICIIPFISAFPAEAQGESFYTYYNYSLGTRAMGMGNAFTAAADDLSAIFWNPAAIAEFKYPELYINYRSDSVYEYLETETLDTGTDSHYYDSNLDMSLKNINFLAVSVPAHFWDTKWHFAVSYYRLQPWGMKGRAMDTITSAIDDSTPFSVNTYDIQGEGGFDVLGLSAAFWLNDYFSLGVTYQKFLNSGSRTTRANLDNFTIYDEIYTEKLKGQNLVVGLLFKPYRDFVIGLGIRTKLGNKLEGRYTYQDIGTQYVQESTADADVSIPARFSVGFMLRPYSFMKLTFDYFIIYWDTGRISNYYDTTDEVQYPTITSGDSQKDSINYRLGMEITIPFEGVKVFVRGGLFREHQLFQDYNSETVKITGYSFGLGVDVASWASLDFAYMRQNADWAVIGVLGNTTGVMDHFKNDIIGISMTFRFANPNLRM